MTKERCRMVVSVCVRCVCMWVSVCVKCEFSCIRLCVERGNDTDCE